MECLFMLACNRATRPAQVDREEMRRRLLGRAQSSGRVDDEEEVIEKRLNTWLGQPPALCCSPVGRMCFLETVWLLGELGPGGKVKNLMPGRGGTIRHCQATKSTVHTDAIAFSHWLVLGLLSKEALPMTPDVHLYIYI